MSMEMTAWHALYHTTQAPEERRPLSLATLRRIGGFARPHAALLGSFLVCSVLGSVLAVATPVVAGQAVDGIVGGAPIGVVGGWALLIAGIALAEAGVGLVARWLSARIGEGLILRLRTAVFDHVQRMPIAFFTRTHTGALVSRLNNDVIGAQRAFSDTLSGVVGNVVTLALTLVVMVGLSWQVTVAALVLLPVFVLPARRVGFRLARLEREAAEHNSAMSTRMAERFSAPGAALVKLFGDPGRESAEFAARATRVHDIGVRQAMLEHVFFTALTLVSALALALVYGLGGFFALRGHLDAGAVVALALLLTRLYAPLTALAHARVEMMGALVSFERVFEVLDLEPLIQERAAARTVPEGPVSVEFDRVRFAYPAPDEVSLASLEEVAQLEARGGADVLHGVSFRVEPGQLVALVGSSGRENRRLRTCWLGSTTWTRARSGCPGSMCGTCRLRPCVPPWAWCPKTGTCSTTPSALTCCWLGRRRVRRSCGRRCVGHGLLTLSRRCPTVSTRWWVSVVTAFPAGNANGSPLPGCCWLGPA